MRFGVAGRVDTTFEMKASADTCRPVASSEQDSGALESASGTHKCAPGVYTIVKLYLIKCSRNLSTRGGRASKLFGLSKGTNSLWSVSIWKVLPKRYIENLSAAQVSESTSFSIWAYHLSVSDIVREEYATGHHSLLTSWSNTAPKP